MGLRVIQEGSEPARGVAGGWLLGSRPLPLPNWSPPWCRLFSFPLLQALNITQNILLYPHRFILNRCCTSCSSCSTNSSKSRTATERRTWHPLLMKANKLLTASSRLPPPPLYLHCADVPHLSIPVKQIRINNGDNLSTWQRVGGDV